MINALYSNKEIFLRELVSNASDAADKLRFEALNNPSLYENDSDLKVKISYNKDQRTITLIDNGVGMSKEEVIQNLGTIAKSGTQEFLSRLSGDQAKDSQLIGQFGVGFYSAFIVADKVVVETRRAGLGDEEGIRWESAGEGEYTIENITKPNRGTTITLHLKSGEDKFLDDWRLRTIIKKYSDHITLPIILIKPGKDSEAPVEETVNQATALWTLPKSEIKDNEYKEFYKHIAHDLEDPLTWSHNRVEGKQEYISLLYIPSKAPFSFLMGEHKKGLKLYVKRVFIMDEAEQFLPNYLRFVRGVIDSNDLPLNISREILQSNKLVDAIRNGLTQRVLAMLDKLSDDKEQYNKFWSNFGQVFKEGLVEDNTNQKAIAKLLRFKSTHSDKEEVTLDEYLNRMKPEQEKIYYLSAETLAAAKASPHIEIFRKKGIEVLFLTDKIDEWLVMHLTEYGDKPLQSVAKGALDLGEDEAEKNKHEEQTRSLEGFIKQVKEVLRTKC
jgi:molecular chaperone HtpG